MRRRVNLAAARAAFTYLSGGKPPKGNKWFSRAPRTWIEYAGTWKLFERWCEERGHTPFPATIDTLERYLDFLSQARLQPTTIEGRLSAIGAVHKIRGAPINRSLLEEDIQGIHRNRPRAPRQARELLREEMLKVMESLDPTHPRDIRDGALLAVLWGGALRQSELSELDWLGAGEGDGSISIEPDGIFLLWRRTKAEQTEMSSLWVYRRNMPSACLWVERWVDLSKPKRGRPLFRKVTQGGVIGFARLASDSVGPIVKRCVIRAQLKEGKTEEEAALHAARISGHSCRAGMITTALLAGESEDLVMKRSRHKSISAFRRYVRIDETTDNNALQKVGF